MFLEVELHDIFMALLMVNNISMSTMDLPPPQPLHPFFFSLHVFLTHIHSSGGERWGGGGKNDLSAALNSLHFYSPEWSGPTKGDIIFSGFDWPPSMPQDDIMQPTTAHHHITTSTSAQSPNPTAPVFLGCWVATATE